MQSLSDTNAKPATNCRIGLTLLGIGLFSLAQAATAVTVATGYQATASLAGGTVFGSTNRPGDVSYSVSGSPTSSATVSFSSSPIPSVNFSGSVSNPLGTTQIQAGGTMTYSFVVAATPFTTVPIDFLGVFSTYRSLSGSGQQGYAAFNLTATNPAAASYASFQSFLTGGSGASIDTLNTSYTLFRSDAENISGSFQGALGMLTGSDGKVSGSVQISAGGLARVIGGTAVVTSYIDPSFNINSAYLATNPGATLTLTSGVGNAIASVPEPSSYVLMLAGLTALALRIRRTNGA